MDVDKSSRMNERDRWNARAEGYDKEPYLEWQRENRLIERIIEIAEPGEDDTVLDLGAGTGRVSLAIAPYVGGVIAVDISEKMLEVAKRKAKERKIDNIQFKLGNFLVPGVDRADLIISNEAMHHLTDDEKGRAIRKMAAILEGGGRVILSDWMIVFDTELLRVRAKKLIDDFSALDLDVGIRRKFFDERPNIYDLGDFLDHAIVSYLPNMPETEHPSRVEDLLGFFEDAGLEVDFCKVTATHGIIRARKI